MGYYSLDLDQRLALQRELEARPVSTDSYARLAATQFDHLPLTNIELRQGELHISERGHGLLIATYEHNPALAVETAADAAHSFTTQYLDAISPELAATLEQLATDPTLAFPHRSVPHNEPVRVEIERLGDASRAFLNGSVPSEQRTWERLADAVNSQLYGGLTAHGAFAAQETLTEPVTPYAHYLVQGRELTLFFHDNIRLRRPPTSPVPLTRYETVAEAFSAPFSDTIVKRLLGIAGRNDMGGLALWQLAARSDELLRLPRVGPGMVEKFRTWYNTLE